MGSTSRPYLIALVSFFLSLQFSAAVDWPAHQINRRQELTSFSVAEQPSSIAESFLAIAPTDISSGKNEKLEASASITGTPEEIPAVTSASQSSQPSAVTSAVNGMTTSSSDYISNSTNLPIVPRVTPGFAVAGTLMILSGAAYTVTGIRNKWLHIYLSAAYLASIGTTVLILYVMSLPVSNAIQAAYVAVVVITGAIIGGTSILFTEMMEGLGCLLGGFCVSMWLLVLQPGGIITGAGKVILIATLTIGGFSTSFSHYTKPYALIGFMSFAGATSIILGVDCFSRAGLKEFWVYLWALNSRLFPLETVSYPLTRGMKAEIGCIFILSLAGIVSQLKLWKVIQERRQQKAAEKFQDNRYIEEEEENIGRRIEINNAKERGQWEEIYGSNDKKSTQVPGRRDSGIADVLSTRERRISNVTSLTCFKDAEIGKSQQRSYATALMDKDSKSTTFTARVVQGTDDHRNPMEYFPPSELNVDPNISDMEVIDTMTRVDSKVGRTDLSPDDTDQNSIGIETNTTTAPVVIPLPFEIPDEPSDKNRSSVSTFATLGDEEDLVEQDRKSSHSSSQLTLQRNKLTHSRVNSKTTNKSGTSHHIEDDRSSLAATIDDLSDDEEIASERFCENDESAMLEEGPNSEFRINQDAESSDSETSSELDVGRSSNPKHLSSQSEINQKFEETASPRSSISGSEAKLDNEIKETSENPEKQVPSANSVIESRSKNITLDILPRQFSKIFMSYRTNEWAKHLDHADAPEIEDLSHSNEVDDILEEKPAPLNVYELQQTPVSTISLQTMHELSEQQSVSARMSSTIPYDVSTPRIIPSEKRNTYLSQSDSLIKNKSQKSLASSKRRTGVFDQSITYKAPPQTYLRGFQGRHETLIGQRDSIIKRKSLYKGSWGSSAFDLGAVATSQASSSDTGSILAQEEEDEDMPLSLRRNLIRQSSLVSTTSWSSVSNTPPMPIKFDSHQPPRRSIAVNQKLRHHQMASWRASLQQDFRAALTPRERIEQQRNIMRMSRRKEEMRRFVEERIKDKREEAWGEKMRSKEMLDAHRDAMRRMQQAANRKVA
ncbi:hypothetical protein K3495_g3583 [Podosphaera aphanis]|nr:hypothetical protein K3495_g3583 [Podosphaera aphanis]